MPRTAPTVDGTPSYKVISCRYIDADGEKRADSPQIDADATAAEIEAHIAALGAASNANLYEVRVSDVYYAAPVASAAVEALRESVHDNLVILVKNSTNSSQDFFVPAPVEATLIPGTSNPDPSNALLAAVITSLAGIRQFFDPITVRFTERREKNPSVPI